VKAYECRTYADWKNSWPWNVRRRAMHSLCRYRQNAVKVASTVEYGGRA